MVEVKNSSNFIDRLSYYRQLLEKAQDSDTQTVISNEGNIKRRYTVTQLLDLISGNVKSSGDPIRQREDYSTAPDDLRERVHAITDELKKRGKIK